jgi:tripeptide aminopeptidase
MIDVDIDRALATFLELVQIDSPTYEERAVIERIAKELEALGLPTFNDRTGRDGAGNLHARLRGTRTDLTPLLVCAHSDTVEPGRGITPVVRDGVVRTDGRTILGADNKASVAAVLEAVRTVVQHHLPHREVDLLFTWGEERGHAGAAAFDTSRLRAQMGVTLDDTADPGHITVAAPAYTSVFARFIGKAAHAGAAPEHGVSAIVAAAAAVSRMRLGRIDLETTANVGLIRGGTARNAIPEMVELEGEARSLDNGKLERQVAALRDALETAARETATRLDLTITQEYAAYRWAESEDIVVEAIAAVRRCGLSPSLRVSGGGSDSNTFNEKGLRCLNIAIGMKEIHTVHEHIAVDDLRKTAQIAMSLITG